MYDLFLTYLKKINKPDNVIMGVSYHNVMDKSELPSHSTSCTDDTFICIIIDIFLISFK